MPASEPGPAARNAARERRAHSLIVATCATFALAAGCDGGRDEPVHPLLSDGRVVELLQDCQRGSYYDQFVDDMLPILMRKLKETGGDPLKRAKEELGAMGKPAAEALRRLVDESFTDPSKGPYIENAIDALALNATREAHDVLIHSLDHPMSSVRQRAMLALVARHALPVDFDTFVYRAEGSEPVELRRIYVRGMFAADRARAEERATEWLRDGEFVEFHLDVALQLQKSTLDSTGHACAELLEGTSAMLAPLLAAPALRVDDPAAATLLGEMIRSGPPNERLRAVQSVGAAGHYDELREPLSSDADATVRMIAIDALMANPELTAAQRAWVETAMTGDASPVVRSHALVELCKLHVPAAIDQALVFLNEDGGELQSSLQALSTIVRDDDDLARRMYDQLLARHASEELRPIDERTATFKAMGIVPLPEAALFLRGLGLAHSREEIEGLRAHEWLMIQATNTGRPGLEALWRELPGETDPVRRLDLIGAVASASNAEQRHWIRELLIELIVSGTDSEYERLFVAAQLMRVGPSVAVAPRLKPISREFADARLQVALQCLLWRWY